MRRSLLRADPRGVVPHVRSPLRRADARGVVPRVRRPLRAALPLALLLVLALMPAAASAHAMLEGTSPQRGAVLRAAPRAVVFRFSEPVEGSFGAVRVYDRTGARADAGDAFHPGGVDSALGVHLRSGAGEGTYTATYRVVSADGHIVSGGFAFSIGHASGGGLSVARLAAEGGSGPVTETAFGIARGAQFLAIALGLGALAFLLLVWRPLLRAADRPARGASDAFVAALRRLVLAAAALGALSAAAAVVLEGAEAAGVSGFDALRPTIVRETLGTRFGAVWGIGVLAWLALAALAAVALRARQGADQSIVASPAGATGERLAEGVTPSAGTGGERPTAAPPRPAPAGERLAPAFALLALPAAFLLLLPALGGHAASESPSGLLVPANVVHVAAMCVWVGGIAALLLALPRATRTLEPADRGRLLAAVLVRFSPLALASVVALLLTGLLQSYVYVRTPAHLLDTPFGRAALIKFLLLLVLIGLGSYQRRRSLPRLRRIAVEGAPPGRAGLLLRRTLRAEAAVILVVLGVTAALTAYAPSIAESSGPFSATTNVGPAQLQLTVDPALVGTNELHLYLLNPRDGSQFTRAKEVTVSETQPDRSIGPLHQPAHIAGPGHYVVTGAVLGVKGDWDVLVTVRVSAFDEYTATVKVPVR